MPKTTLTDKTEDLEPLLISLAHLLAPAILPGLKTPKSQVVLCLKIRAHLNNANSAQECWVWGGKSRDYNGHSGIIVHGGKRYRARRVLVEWLVGTGFQNHYIKPACGEPWCHNPFHQRVLPIKSRYADTVRVTCKRGHDYLNPDNYTVITRANGTTARVCKLCTSYLKDISYKSQSLAMKRQRRAGRTIIVDDSDAQEHQ